MNALSWLLYWADVLPKLSTWLAIVSFLLMAASIVCCIAYWVCKEETRENWESYRDEETMTDKAGYVARYTDLARSWRRLWFVNLMAPLFFVLWGVSFLVPNKETFYLIAASQAGQQAVQTPEFAKMRGIVNKYLDGVLDEGKEEKKEEKSE